MKIDSKTVPLPITQIDELKHWLSTAKVKSSFTTESDDKRKLALVTAKRLGVKVTSRKVDGKGYRIWRVL